VDGYINSYPFEGYEKQAIDQYCPAPGIKLGIHDQALAWQGRINTLVYELYGLTEEEIRIVESA
jgi:hypothetical protein